MKRFENMTDQELIDFCHENMLDIRVCKALGCKELCKDEDCPITQVLCRFEKLIVSTKEETL